MADPVTIGTLAAAALSAGAGALGKEVVGAVIKDAYTALKGKLAGLIGNSDVDKLEADPESRGRALTLSEEVDKQPDAARDEIKALAEALQAALQAAGQGAVVDNRITQINVSADRGGIAAGRDVNLGDLNLNTNIGEPVVAPMTTTTTWPQKK